MSVPTMKVEVDGKLRDLDDCSWYQIAPCGCACGVTLVTWPGGGEAVVTPESAHRHMTENAEIRRREDEAGFRMELGLRADVRERLGNCEHSPRYGVEETPIPDGYEWAEAPGDSSSKARRHLAPKDAVGA